MGPTWAQKWSKMSPKWVQNELKMGIQRDLPFCPYFWPPSDPSWPPNLPQNGPQMGPKKLKIGSKMGARNQRWFLLIFCQFFDQKLVQKSMCFWWFFSASIIAANMRKSSKTLEKQMVFDDFSSFERSKSVKKSIKNASQQVTPKWRPFWTHFEVQNWPKMVPSWTKNGQKNHQKTRRAKRL